MKVILILAFVSDGAYNLGTTETMKFEMPDMAHCESVAENLKEIYSIDPAFLGVKVSTNCVDMP